MNRSYHILTFGCQMNVNDSAWLARSLEARGFSPAPLTKATVIICNTCSVREKPERKVYATLQRIAHASRHTAGAFVVVSGCVAQQVGERFFADFPQVRLITGGDGLHGAPQAIELLLEDKQARLSFLDFSPQYAERPLYLEGALPKTPRTETPYAETSHAETPYANAHAAGASCGTTLPTAYVNIMQGCDNYCAYCIVPYTRGRQKSRHPKAVVAECQSLLHAGVREITLLGQNVNAFGQDLTSQPPVTFADLLHNLATLPLPRLRFVTPHPKDFSATTIEALGRHENICPRLHLPLQAGSDAVLQAMGRQYSKADFLTLVRRIRAARPDIAFSSDIIVGFPQESEADFVQTLEVVEEVGFMSSYSFCYSDRPGTRASLMQEKIDHEVQLERLSRLQTLQDRLGQAYLHGRVGQETPILLEGPSGKAKKAAPARHTTDNAPDSPHAIDTAQAPDSASTMDTPPWAGRDPYGVTVNVSTPLPAARVGDILRVRITEAKRHTLRGEMV